MLCNKTGILLSGGMDSMCIAYWKRPDVAFTIDYGQVCASSEIRASKYIAKELGIEHIVLNIDCSSLGSGLLAGQQSLSVSPTEEWWPYRNQLLITLASMKAISMGITTLYIGSIKSDNKHVDGTKKFYELLSQAIYCQEGHLKVEVPAIDMDAIELIKISKIPDYMLLHSHSCHTSNIPCMVCPGCIKNYAIRQMLSID